jgi:arylsulfatase A-like enzyme
VRLPGQVEGARHRAPVQHVDVVPTLLELLGVEPDGAALEGRSLVPLLEGEPLPDGLAYAAIDTLRSVTDGRRKLILDLRQGTGEMYDLAADPGERRDVARDPRSAGALRRLRAELRGWIARTEGEAGLGLSEEAQRRLEALGYL